MPLYEYECKCGHKFEELRSMSSEPWAKCPNCGRQASRIMSSCSLRFKGPGFYCNDYPKRGEGADRGQEEG